MMKKHWLYLKYVVRHKWFVFLACLQYGLIWRGIKHDWNKFLPSEWIPYTNYFYGRPQEKKRDSTGYHKPTDTGDAAFDFAWLLHQKRCDHHWQWWVLPEDNGGIKVLKMSDCAMKEMLCDWRGAGRAQGKPKTWEWYAVNKDKMQLHPETRAWIEKELARQEHRHNVLTYGSAQLG